MANKRPTSRERRARQNRAQREALASRTKAAATPRSERPAPKAPSRGAPRPSNRSTAGSDAGTETGGRTSLRPARPDRPDRLGSKPVDLDTLEGGWFRRLLQVPGGVQVLFSVVLVLTLTVVMSISKSVPPEGAPRDADPTRTIWEAFGPAALLIVVPPLAAAVNALVFALTERRRRMWTISAVMIAVFAIALFQIGYLFPAGFMGYAVMRSRQVEDGVGRRGRRPLARDEAEGDPEERADDGADEPPWDESD